MKFSIIVAIEENIVNSFQIKFTIIVQRNYFMYKVNLLKINFRLGNIIEFIFIFIYISFIFTELNIICKCKNILNWLVNIFNISCI